MKEQDQRWLRHAVQLSERAGIETSPNPRVGCVIIRDNQILGEGWTQPVGQAHAEVQALRDAQQRRHDVRGATAYVSLEPCSHFGRTPPCAFGLRDAGIARVVAAAGDANPLVSGKGFAILREAGIEVLAEPDPALAQQVREMNIGFFHRMETGLPWVRLKMAASLDGRTALPNGQSQWITGPDARQDGHRWRARADVILTGIGTVLADNPQLNVRGTDIPRQPPKWVIDSRFRTPLNSHVTQGAALTVIGASDNAQRLALQDAGVQTLLMPDPEGKVDLAAVVRALGKQQCNEVHVEAGAALSGALVDAGLVNEILLYMAPKFLGAGAGVLALPEMQHVSQARTWQITEFIQIGQDIRLRLR